MALSLLGCNSEKPNVLIIGDSISVGYAPHVKRKLKNIADVKHINENAQHTSYGLSNIDSWLQNNKWEVILFNWGLWDLCYRIPDSTSVGKKDKISGIQETSLTDYKQNLDSLVKILKETNAKLVFVTTTFVPEGEPGMFTKDVPKYNQIAKEVMNQNDILVIDLYDKSIEIHSQFGKGYNNVHYYKRGYKKLGALISDKLISIVNKANKTSS